MSLDLLAWPWWLVAGILAAAAVATLRLRRAEAVRLPPLRRRALDVLRLAGLGVAALALAEPVAGFTTSRLEPAAVAIVIDRSGSMDLADAGLAPSLRLDEAVALGLLPADLRPDAAARAVRLVARIAADPAAATGSGAVRRLAAELAGEPALAAALAELARALEAGDAAAARAAATALDGPLRRSQERLDAALLAGAGEGRVGQALAALAAMPRRDRAQRLAERLAERLGGAAVDWFVLDERLVPVDGPEGARLAPGAGAATDLGEGLAGLARGWAGRGHPSACLLLSDGRRTAGADPEPAARALAARGVRLVPIAIGDPDPPPAPAIGALSVPPTAVSGAALRLAATVRLPDGAGDWSLAWLRDGHEVARQVLPPAAGWRTCEAAAVAGAAGVEIWEARLLPPAAGAPISAYAAVAVAASPPGVLVAGRSPRWELRHAAAALTDGLGAAVELRLRTAIGAAAPLLPDAVLARCDLVVLGDADGMDPDRGAQERLLAFVRGGGALVLVGGTAPLPATAPLWGVLPVSAPSRREAVPAPALPGPALGLLLPALPEDLPALPWWLGAEPLPGTATALEGPGGEPLVALGTAGAGRCAWVGGDELWRWRARDGGRLHDGLWQALARWCLGARTSGADPSLQLALDRAIAAPGEPVLVRLVAAAEPEVRLRRPAADGGDAEDGDEVDIERDPARDGAWLVQLNTRSRPLAPGRWQLLVQSGERVERRSLLVHRPPGREQLEPATDRAALDRLAEAGGGRAVAPGEALAEVASLGGGLTPRWIEVRRRLTPWDGPWWLLLFTGLLAWEWAWRRRSGLP